MLIIKIWCYEKFGRRRGKGGEGWLKTAMIFKQLYANYFEANNGDDNIEVML